MRVKGIDRDLTELEVLHAADKVVSLLVHLAEGTPPEGELTQEDVLMYLGLTAAGTQQAIRDLYHGVQEATIKAVLSELGGG